MKKNNKGFTLVELLAVIVVLAIVMGLAAVAITGVLNNTRKSAFAADAKSFLEGAHSLVTSDDLNSMLGATTGSYAPSCANGTGETKYIPLSAIKLERGGEKSPYGNAYKKGTGTAATTTKPTDGSSYIEVISTVNATTNECTFEYKIFLSDGVYGIGTATATITETDVDLDDVKVLSAS